MVLAPVAGPVTPRTGKRQVARWFAARLPGQTRGMRYESTVTSLSWIPSEAIEGSTRLAFDAGFTHHDDPPPAEIADLRELQARLRLVSGARVAY